MRIPITKDIRIYHVRSQTRTCIWCGELMRPGTHGVSIEGIDGANAWLHILCLPPMAKTVAKVFKQHQPQLVANALEATP